MDMQASHFVKEHRRLQEGGPGASNSTVPDAAMDVEADTEWVADATQQFVQVSGAASPSLPLTLETCPSAPAAYSLFSSVSLNADAVVGAHCYMAGPCQVPAPPSCDDCAPV